MFEREGTIELTVVPVDQIDGNLFSTSEAAGVYHYHNRDVTRETWYDWHCKLGHLAEESLKKLTLNTVGVELEVPERSTFEDCTVCQQLPPINVEEVTSKKQTNLPLKLLHLHVSKSSSTSPNEEKPYVILIVDDFTNYCQVNFCHDELDMLLHLEDFIYESKFFFITRLHAVQLEGLTSEFYHLVLKWLKQRRIGVSTTFKHTRRAYPKAARLLNIFVRTAKVLLSDSSYKDFFWGETIERAAYLFNTSTVINGLTPYEHWFGLHPNLAKIKRFGTHVYCNNQEYMYIGLEHKFHKVWDPNLRNAFYFLNVISEDEYADEDQNGQPLQHPLERKEGENAMCENLTYQTREAFQGKRQREIFINLLNQYQENAQLRHEVAENVLRHNHRVTSKRSQETFTLDHRDFRRILALAQYKNSKPMPHEPVEEEL